jgi:cytochrome c biogenesis protein CcdA
MSKASLMLILFIMLLPSLFQIRTGYAAEPVLVEFFYYEPCTTCPNAAELLSAYHHNTQLVNDIESDYGARVLVNRTWFYNSTAPEDTYNLSIPLGWNAIVVNREFAITGYADEAFTKTLIDFLLESFPMHDVAILDVLPSSKNVNAGDVLEINVTMKNGADSTQSFNTTVYYGSKVAGSTFVDSLAPNSTWPLVVHWDTDNVPDGNYTLLVRVEHVQNGTVVCDNLRYGGVVEVRTPYQTMGLLPVLTLAFSFGFFETFSPCLIVLLSFILSFTIGETVGFKKNFSQVMIFGGGFLLAALVLGLSFGLVFLSLPALTLSLTLGVSIFAIIFGLNLLGVFKVPIETKPAIQKLAKKYVFTYLGLFFLGFVFYFLDPCIAPIFVSMVPLLYLTYLPLILLIFCIGAIIPFIIIGASAGSISKLTRSVYRNRTKIRAISGLILIGYALYLIVGTIILK